VLEENRPGALRLLADGVTSCGRSDIQVLWPVSLRRLLPSASSLLFKQPSRPPNIHARSSGESAMPSTPSKAIV
jgi:hypothetical protein